MLETNEEQDARLVNPQAEETEDPIETALRPRTLAEFVGQAHIKEPLSISMAAAKQRHEPIEHVLLYGNPGLGKTTLAHIIAREMGGDIRVTAGPALERMGDLAAILSNLQTGDVLFIDEIHRLNKTIEETLYAAMEDYALDIIVGKGPTARTLRMPLEKFTLIGATTKLNLLSGPLRDRFGHVFHLNFYEENDINTIIKRNARLLQVEVAPDASALIAARARRTPRVANRLLKRVRDYAQVRADGTVTLEVARAALQLLQVDDYGFDEVDRKLLRTIIDKFSGGPVGVNSLAAAIHEEKDAIEDIYEPFLIQAGFLDRTPRGRVATARAYEYFGLTAPEKDSRLW